MAARRAPLGALLAAALFTLASPARADVSVAAARDRFMVQRNAVVGALGAWTAIDLAGGALLFADPPWLPRVAPTRPARRAFAAAIVSFAVVNAVFVASGIAGTGSLRASLVDQPAITRERLASGDFFAFNVGLDMLYLAAGALLATQPSSPTVRGFGLGVLVQGGALLGYDTTSSLVYRHGGR